MKLATCFYDKNHGWVDPAPTELDSDNTLVIVFGAARFLDDAGPLSDLVSKFPQSKFIGCSTAGEIFGRTVNDEGIVAAVAQFERTTLASAIVSITNASDSFAAGEAIARELDKPDLRGVMVLSDGLNVNGSQLVSGINSILPPAVITSGGLAGDSDRFQKTWILKDGVPTSNFVSAVGFYGRNVSIRHGSKGGWDIFGPERRVTKSQDNLLFELDGKPALELYKNYLGDRAKELPSSALLFPLSLRADANDDKRIVRTILNVDEANQSMTFAGDVPEGWLVQLMRANFDRLIDGASAAALMTYEHCESDVLSIAISCVGRRLILGERAEEELDAVMDCLPSTTKQIGFYSYGEISPHASGNCDLHNQTMTLTTISES